MNIFHWFFISCFIVTNHYTLASTKTPKIVALVPGHNDSRFLTNCFKALSLYVDAIVYLDDASTDKSVEIAQSLVKECNIEQILCKKNWIRHAAADRNILLAAGRAIGGTHFVLIDADEMPTANLLDEQTLRRIILNLKPGERLALAWIQLWRSCDHYRYDSSVWTNNYKDIAFCDDGTCMYYNRKLCESRTPDTLQGKTWFIEGYEYGLLHFQFVNWENLLRKQAWYRCQERIIQPNRTVEDINKEYAPSKNEIDLGLKNTPNQWFANYDFLNFAMLSQKEHWREKEVMTWFATYGIGHFTGLDIWDTQWAFDDYIKQAESFLGTFVIGNHKKQGIYVEIGDAQNNYNPAKVLHTKENWVKKEHLSLNQPIDICIVHQKTMLNEKDIAHLPVTLLIHEQALSNQLEGLLDRFNYVKIPYNDHDYNYFIKRLYG